MATDTGPGDSSAVHHPTGTQRFLSRSLETFFARWPLFVLPLLLIGGFGIYSATSNPDEYRSVGTLSVSYQTFLGELSQVRDADFGFESPSSRTSRHFNELMQTDGFVHSVLDRAEVDVPGARAIPLETVRSIVVAVSGGDFLMHVIGVADGPVVANVLVRSAITAFSEWVIDTEVSASDAAVAFYDAQLADFKADVEAKDAALADYLTAHPAPADITQPRDIGEQLQIESLNEDLSRAQVVYYSALDKRDSSRVATTLSAVDVGQRLRVVDQPSLPTAPEGGLREAAITMMIFLVLGGLVSVGAVALISVLDRSVHSVSDLERLGAPALAVVPRTKRMTVKHPKIPAVSAVPKSRELRSA